MKPITCFVPSSTSLPSFVASPILSFPTSSSTIPTQILSSSFYPNDLPTTHFENIIINTPTSSILTSSTESTTFLPENPLTILPIILAALLLGFASQSFINSMLKGDQGLGAFLQDGSGYSKSGFKPRASNNKDGQPLSGDDPLPWLKLPQLDFVEVAGQEEERLEMQRQQKEEEEAMRILDRLEQLRQRMNEELKMGNREEATTLKDELEVLAKEYGFEYKEGFE